MAYSETFVACVNGKWNPVVLDATSAWIRVPPNVGKSPLFASVPAGNDPPVGIKKGVMLAGDVKIDCANKLDVYMWPITEDVEVRVDVDTLP